MNVVERRVVVVAFVAATWGTSGRALGQNSPPEADRLFQEGRAALGEERYETARSAFERSYKLDPALGTLLNLAVCEEKLGKLGAALGHLRQALSDAAPSDRRYPLIEQRIARLEVRLPRVTIQRPPSIDSTVTISLDTRPVAATDLGRAIHADPGTHVLDCAGERGERCTTVFTLSEGEVSVQVLKLTQTEATKTIQALPSGPPTPPVTSDGIRPAPLPPPGTNKSVAYAVGGFSLATVVVGLIAGGAVLRQKGIVDGHCDERGCDSEGFDAAQAGRTFSTISTVTTAIGVAGLGVSAYLLLSVPSPRSPTAGWSLAGTF